MTPLEQIDFVFFYIKNETQHGGSIGYHNIENRVIATDEAKITITTLKEILKRLEADGYITKGSPADSQPVYHTSFNGLLFDGYKNAKQKNDREATFQKRLNSSNFWTPILTGVLALITLLRTFVGCGGEKKEVNVIYNQVQEEQQKQMPKNQFQHDSLNKNSPDVLKTA